MTRRRLAGRLAGLNWRQIVQSFLLFTAAAIMQSVNFNLFLAPTDTAPGGISGIAIMVQSFTGWSYGLIMLGLSLVPLAFGFRYLGRFWFLVSTLYITVVYSLSIDLLAAWLPPAGITDDALLNAVFGGVIGGICSGLAFRGRGTFSGTGIISRIIQLHTGIPITQLYMFIDGSIILALGLVFGWENALYALVMLFLWGIATDYVLEGPSVVRTAFIVTDAPRAVADALLTRMGVGVTAWDGRGMFTEAVHTVLFCTISRPDVSSLQSIVSQADPAAFVVIGQGHRRSGGVLRQPEQASNNHPNGAKSAKS